MLNAEKTPQPYSTDMVQNSQKYIEYAYLANRIYDEGDSTVGQTESFFGQLWKLIRYTSEKNGFQAGIYKNLNTNKYIVAIGGTKANPTEANSFQKFGGSILDVATDLRLISNLIPDSQSKSALNFIDNRVVEENGKNHVVIIDAIVGHSLGGGLAAYAGLYSGIKSITFNPSPIPFTRDSVEPLLNRQALTIVSKDKDGKVTRFGFPNSYKITNIMSQDDPVSLISFLLESTDNIYYSASLPLGTTTNKGKWNFLKQGVLLIPGRLHLDYANMGKNIWLPIETGHPISMMLEKMKDAKYIDDYNKLDAVNTFYSKKLKKINNSKYRLNTYYISYYGEKANLIPVLAHMRNIYATIKKINIQGSDDSWDDYFTYDKFLISLGLKDTDIEKRVKASIQGNISYKEYMLIAEAMYKKVFGGPAFFSNLRKKSKLYLVYDAKRAKYASKEMNKIYGHIFLLHLMRGTPKKYLQNDSQDITNAFVINFLDRFLDVLVMYKSKIK